MRGDPDFTKVAAGNGDGTRDALYDVEVTLPADKTCDICTLQWVWSAENDGGSYVGCADVSITADGQPVAPAPQPTAGEVLAGVPGEVYATSPPPEN